MMAATCGVRSPIPGLGAPLTVNRSSVPSSPEQETRWALSSPEGSSQGKLSSTSTCTAQAVSQHLMRLLPNYSTAFHCGVGPSTLPSGRRCLVSLHLLGWIFCVLMGGIWNGRVERQCLLACLDCLAVYGLLAPGLRCHDALDGRIAPLPGQKRETRSSPQDPGRHARQRRPK